MTSTLHGFSDAALEFERSAGDAAGKDLALFVEELLEELGILIVDILDAAAFETAVFFLFGVYRQGSEVTDFAVCCHG